MTELEFWRTCCERGVTLCRASKPFQEHRRIWLAEKHPTFVDRSTWTSAWTFDELEAAMDAIGRYFATGVEPRTVAGQE
jgi:hypothetical protein